MPDSANLWAFGRAFRGHMFAAMSGGFSVPFAGAAIWLDNAYAKSIFAALAFGGSWFAAYTIWKSEREKVLALEDAASPKLLCSFSNTDPGCVRPNSPINSAMLATYYRIKVEAAKAVPVFGCHGRLVEIKRGDNIIFSGEKFTLPFAYASEPDAVSKTIHPDAPEHLDFLAISYDNAVLLTPHGLISTSVNWHDLFVLAGEYTLKIVVGSSRAASQSIELLLRWTLNHRTSEIRCLNPS